MSRSSTTFALPFLTAPDPAISGEGAIDPLGFATVGDRLADWFLPGMTARMIRPRFLTAIAVSAVVCEGMEEEIAADRVTPTHVVFEWLLVEGFARAANRSDVRQTPGIDKASEALDAGVPMSAKAYLKAASVFGFHGVYKRLARHLGIVDDDLRLNDNGYALVKEWESEQGLDSFLETAAPRSPAGNLRHVLRSAVEDALLAGYTTRKAGWQGWEFFAQHLAPAKAGRREAEFIWRMLLDAAGDTRGEVFRLVATPENLDAIASSASDAEPVCKFVPPASHELAPRLKTILAYEAFCTPVEDAFDWLRYLSTRAGARALPRSEFAGVPEVRKIASELGSRLNSAQEHIDQVPGKTPQGFAGIAEFFEEVHNAEQLYDAVLHRHAEVQRRKPPEGKREWFEHAADGSVFVRIPYRQSERPASEACWRRPYRLRAVRSFCLDLRGGEA